MNINKNEIYQIEITGITSEGNGVGKIDNFAIFIPETTIGDIINVRIIKVLKSYAYGKIENIIKPSNKRIEIDCNCYTQCGGCTYRHISYEAELQIKKDLVENNFKRLGGIDISCNEIIGSKKIDEYRNKAQYPVGKDKDGNIISGFYAKRSHRIVNCNKCLLQTNDFEIIKSIILQFLQEFNISIYDENLNKGLIRHIYIRKAEATGEIMVCLVSTKRKIPNIDILINKLLDLKLNIASIILNINNKATNVILGNECITLYGQDEITDIICGIKIKISPLSFYQVNKSQAEVLYQTAINYANLKKDDIVIDLYCGTGTIGLIAASKVKQIIGIEIIPQAIENAKENAKLNNIENARFMCADAKIAANNLVQEGIKPNVVIVDPPRKGLDKGVIDSIIKMSPERLVMVSCNPATAARDVSILNGNGYEVNIVTPVDMFPRTGHVETVVLMSRVDK